MNEANAAVETSAEGTAEESVDAQTTTIEYTPKNPEVVRYISQKESQLREAQQQLDAQRAQMEEWQRKASELDRMSRMLREQPTSVLQAHGVQLDDLVSQQKAQNDPQQAVMRQLQAEIAPLQQKLANYEQKIAALENAEKQRYEEATHSEISSAVESAFGSEGEDKYPFVASLGERGRALVIQRVQAAIRDGKDVGVTEAIGEVERELEPVAEEWIKRYLARQKKEPAPPATLTNDLPGTVGEPEDTAAMPQWKRLERLIQKTQIAGG